jgi:hypothetical protein
MLHYFQKFEQNILGFKFYISNQFIVPKIWFRGVLTKFSQNRFPQLGKHVVKLRWQRPKPLHPALDSCTVRDRTSASTLVICFYKVAKIIIFTKKLSLSVFYLYDGFTLLTGQ